MFFETAVNVYMSILPQFVYMSILPNQANRKLLINIFNHPGSKIPINNYTLPNQPVHQNNTQRN